MDLTLLSSDKEQVVLVRVEVEAHTTSESISEGLLLVVEEFLVLVNNQLELDNFFSLQLVLHQVPVGDTSVTGDGVEVQILAGFLGLPAHLPDGVGMLGSADS
jgi:hypothetical protein